MVGDDSEQSRYTAFPVGQICSLLAETSSATADEVRNIHKIRNGTIRARERAGGSHAQTKC